MKICPICRRTYAEASQFCQGDGSPLQPFAGKGTAATTSAPSAPTAVADATDQGDQVTVVQSILPPHMLRGEAPEANPVILPAIAEAIVPPAAPAVIGTIAPEPQPEPVVAPIAAVVATPNLPAIVATPKAPAAGAPPPLPPPGKRPASGTSTDPAKSATPPATETARPTGLARNRPGSYVHPPADLGEAATLVTSLENDIANLPGGEDEVPYIGTLIADRYLVQSMIGRGGMGAVYRVEQIHLRKTMAIKLLHESLTARKQLISRFTREARAISRLSSPHTVMVYDFGRWGDLFYLVMDLLEGEALDALLEREGPLPGDRVTRLVLQMCDSLAEAHKHGIVHRDLKPENVMLVRNASHPDFVKILDFGLAKVQGVDDPYTIHSQRDIFGTPYYMSPEQIRAGDVDARADIYAVGALMFRMLTGQYVFSDRNTFDILKAHLMEKPPRMADLVPDARIAPALEQIVAKALEKDPAKRFQSMEEFATALTAAQLQGFTALPSLPMPPTVAESATGTAKLAAVVVAAVPPPKAEPAEPAEPVEAMEQRARRSRGMRFAGFLALCLGALAALGGWLLISNAEQVGGVEHEPNDTLHTANPLDSHREARGMVGKRQSAQRADLDCFRLPPVKENEELSVRITGVPNMDLAVSVLGRDGEPILSQSHDVRGQGEWLRHVDGRNQPSAVCVTEYLAQGATAGESLSDEYKLHVDIAVRQGNEEREPNDGNGKEITDLAPHVELAGALDGPLDRDVCQLQGNFESRIVRAMLDLKGVQGPTGIRMALLDNSKRTLASLVLRHGELHAVLAFAATGRQMPDRVVLERVGGKDGAPVQSGPIDYVLHYEDVALADQSVVEPNNTEDSATPMVLGAWHTGNADDAAGVDWLSIDGGDATMTRIRVEAVAPGAGTYWLTVRDQGTQVDLRKLQVQPGLDAQPMVVSGSGEGFLLRIQQVEAARRGRQVESRYQIRARYLAADDEAH